MPKNLHKLQICWISTMADVKISISVLCKHLNFLFSMKTKPEMFRLAKYNKSDDKVVEIFWSLLKNIIELPATDNIVQDIKRYFLQDLKYESIQFYSLPENMSSGSRELLLAVGYVLAHNHLEKFIKRAIENSPLNPNFAVETDNLDYKPEKYSFSLKQLKTENDIEHAIQWIEGRINCNKKAVLEYHNCLSKMSSKLSKGNTNSLPNIDQLSLSEVLALNNAEYSKDFVERTENVSKIVQNHDRWLKNQSVFWEWMDSVLLERQKEVRMANLEELDKFIATLN